MSETTDHDELLKKLDAEGDIAADYLEELLDIADIVGDLDIAVEAQRPSVAIVSDEGMDPRLKRLIGDNGEVLDALQELTRLAVQTATGDRSRLMLDIGGYRAQHRAEIAEIAKKAIQQVVGTGESYALDPMNPFERKVVHDVAAEAGIHSDSEGYGADRHVVLSPEGPDENSASEENESDD